MKKQIIKLTLLLAGVALLAACGENTRDTSSSGPNQIDHAAEAEKTITAENMDQHLEKLEAEISRDESAIEE